MPQKAFYIGPYESGLINAVKPFALPEDAFSVMENAYVWRGRVKKRIGSSLFTNAGVTSQYEQLYSRLRIQVDTTVAGAAAGVCPGTIVGADCLGQMFSIGNEIFTVHTTPGGATPMLATGASITHTFNVTTRAYNFVGAAAAEPVWWYPSRPVMGITNYEISTVNDEPTIAFDDQFAYQRAGGGWTRLGAVAWTGSDSQFFWATNHRGTLNNDYTLFVVNNNQPDSIKYWNDSTGPGTWQNLAPATRVAANYILHSARLIVSFKDHLIALNTLEQTGAALPALNFAQRARWCQNGSPLAADAWYDNVPGKGGWIEAPTKEVIITARILKDRLIVYFERSTWELVYTNNQVLPFVWQTIDAQLGAESTFSSVLLDKVVFGIGSVGVHQCDGLTVSRIDEKIPQEVFKIHNGNNGVERVAGIRDYATEMAYWAYPSAENNSTYPNRMLVYNYKDGSWSFNDDSITAFGYFQNTDDLTWGSCTYTWEEFDRLWRSGFNQSLSKNVIGGNQEGFCFIMDSAKNSNAPALQITDIDLGVLPLINLTVVDHNLKQGDFILIEYVQGTTNLNNLIFEVISADPAFPDTFTIREKDGLTPVGAYTGGGLISRVSRMDIRTKQFNFYQDNQRLAINEVQFDVDRSANGQVYVNFFTSTSGLHMSNEAIGTLTNVGNYMLDTSPYALVPLEANQDRLVRPVYIQAEGDCVQLQLTWTDEQMQDLSNMRSAFEMNSMTFYGTVTGKRR